MAKPKKATRAQVGLRVPEDLRERVEYAAKLSGRSLNAEILERLEQSFRAEDRLGGPTLSTIVEILAAVMNATGQRAAGIKASEIMDPDRWLDMPYPYDQAKGAAIAFLESFKPQGKIVVPKRSVAEALAHRKTEDDPKETEISAERAGYIARKILRVSSSKKEQDDE